MVQYFGRNTGMFKCAHSANLTPMMSNAWSIMNSVRRRLVAELVELGLATVMASATGKIMQLTPRMITVD